MIGLPHTDIHIRPVRLRSDLNQIADLIEICFAPYLDAEGRDYIKHIRNVPKDYAGYILENSTPESSHLPFHGFVWIENNRIVGNLTLIYIRRYLKQAYFVANVAVHPDFRGRGIARSLTDKAIEHVIKHKGNSIYLQVRSENTIAQNLYLSHGFTEMTRRTQWIYRPGQEQKIQGSQDVRVSSRKKEDWQQQKDWLISLFPAELAWNFSLQVEKMEPTFLNGFDQFINGIFQRTWSAYDNNNLIGTATLVKRGEPNDHIWLATTPVWEEKAISALLPVIQKHTLSPHKLSVNYPAGRAVDAFHVAGMVETNTLIWMKRLMESQSIV